MRQATSPKVTTCTSSSLSKQLIHSNQIRYPYKYDYLGRLNTGVNLTWAHSKVYYNWIQNFLLNDNPIRDCAPPYFYNDTSKAGNPLCYNLSQFDQSASRNDSLQLRLAALNGKNATVFLPPEILKCFTGLMPYFCPTMNQTIENVFLGYVKPVSAQPAAWNGSINGTNLSPPILST